MRTFIFLLLASTSLVYCQQIPYAVDLLTLFSSPLRCETPGPMTSAAMNDASFLGTRQLNCDNTGGPEVTTRAVVGSLQCNTAAMSFGSCRIDYNNIGGQNFRDIGCGCWNFIEENPDRQHSISVTTTSGATTSSSSVSLGAFNGMRDICLPLQAPFTVFDSVDSIQLDVDGTIEAQLDVVLNQFCCVPRGDAWHSIVPDGQVLPGTCSTVTATIANPPRMPDTVHDTTWTFDHPGGRITAPSLSCTGSGAAFIAGSERSLSGSTTLSLGQQFSCTWEVCWDVQGDYDMWLVVNDVTVGSTYQSHSGGPRAGTPQVCGPPSPTQVSVQAPPTTAPPTTIAPTPPPPEVACVHPTVGPNNECMCDPLFPCRQTGPKEWHCDVDEWYCIFLRTNIPRVEYQVGYFNRTCTCLY